MLLYPWGCTTKTVAKIPWGKVTETNILCLIETTNCFLGFPKSPLDNNLPPLHEYHFFAGIELGDKEIIFRWRPGILQRKKKWWIAVLWRRVLCCQGNEMAL